MSVAAVVLAAGLSRRMAPENKLLIPLADGVPMIAHVVDHVLEAGIDPVLVVAGHQKDEIERALGDRPIRLIFAADYGEGLAASLKAGIRAVPEACEAAIVCLGDMPLVDAPILRRLLAAYRAGTERGIVVPVTHGRRGNPVVWDRRHFEEILELSGDTGARSLFPRHAAEIVEVDVGNEAIFRDVDTPEALAALPGRF